MRVSNITSTINKPKNLLPNEQLRFVAEIYSFVLNDTNNAFANAILRYIKRESKFKHLVAEEFSTTDKFIIPEFIKFRFNWIPISQQVAVDTKYELKYHNKSAAYETVYLDMCGNAALSKVTNNHVIIDINPGHNFTAKLKVVENTGQSSAGATLVCLGRMVPVGEPVYNAFTGEGKSVSISNPTAFKITFETNGTIKPADVVKQSCTFLQERLRKFQHDIENKNIIHDNVSEINVIIENDNHTLGNMMMKGIINKYNIPLTYKSDLQDMISTLRFVPGPSTAEVRKIIIEMTKYYIAELDVVMSAF